MKTINDYLDAYAAAVGVGSDYAIAKKLSLTRQAVSRYRNEAGSPCIDTCWQIADAIGERPEAVIAAAEIQRASCANDSARAQLWRARLSSVSAGAVTLFSAIALLPLGAASALECILCQIAKGEMWRGTGILPALRNRSISEQSALLLIPICHKEAHGHAKLF